MQPLSSSNPVKNLAVQSLERAEMKRQRMLNALVKINLSKYLKKAGEDHPRNVIISGMHIRIE
jgi:hypothetical protein